MDSREYLNYVLDKLQERIRKLDDAILHGQKEIENMHEYYWENYTEMDQYGYEDFDNQQALLGQVNANKEKLDLRRRFKKMLDSPFFGRVDFIYDGEEEAETFYIGIGNFSKESGRLPLVYDWRAPVSSLFYDYDKGEAYYDAPADAQHGFVCGQKGAQQQRLGCIAEKIRLAAGGDALLPVELRVHVAAAGQQQAVAGQGVLHCLFGVAQLDPAHPGSGAGQTFHVFGLCHGRLRVGAHPRHGDHNTHI